MKSLGVYIFQSNESFYRSAFLRIKLKNNPFGSSYSCRPPGFNISPGPALTRSTHMLMRHNFSGSYLNNMWNCFRLICVHLKRLLTSMVCCNFQSDDLSVTYQIYRHYIDIQINNGNGPCSPLISTKTQNRKIVWTCFITEHWRKLLSFFTFYELPCPERFPQPVVIHVAYINEGANQPSTHIIIGKQVGNICYIIGVVRDSLICSWW